MACDHDLRDHPDGGRSSAPSSGPRRTRRRPPTRRGPSGTSSSSSSCCAWSSRRRSCSSRRSASRRSAWCSCCCCRSTTAARSGTRCGGRSPRRPGSRPSLRWSTSACSARSAGSPTRDRARHLAAVRAGQGDHRLCRLSRLPQDRRERQHARAEPHHDRRPPGARRSRGRCVTPLRRCRPTPLSQDQPGAVRQARAVRRVAQGRQSRAARE